MNTSTAETAVCNLGSVNLARHMCRGHLDKDLLADTVTTAIRMLDNVIDLNFYPTPESESANSRHRPVGLGVMGMQDALYEMNLNFDDDEAVEFSDGTQEFIAYHAILASSKLAAEKGRYPSYAGSKWSRGILPADTVSALEDERGIPTGIDGRSRLDWAPVREHIARHGMRNSNCMAIAPTATIANIAGCFPSIEPIYKNIYVKSNFSGEFTVINARLVDDLKQLGLWSPDMVEKLKYYDGSVQHIEEIPPYVRAKYKEAFEIDPKWIIRHAAHRGKWIDQSQSVNVFTTSTSGRFISEIYRTAWEMGLKTTYYLRTLGASAIEKSTLDQKKRYEAGAKSGSPPDAASEKPVGTFVAASASDGSACSADDPTCEACQ